MRLYFIKHFILLIFPLLLWHIGATAQQPVFSDTLPAVDTSESEYVTSIKEIGAIKASQKILELKLARAELRQDELFENIRKTILKAKDYIKRGIDTTDLEAELNRIINWHRLASDGVFINTGTAQTHRNLVSTARILQILLDMANARKATIDRYKKGLVNLRYEIDSLSSDSAIYNLPSDSVSLVKYLQKLVSAVSQLRPMDSTLKKATENAQQLQEQVNTVVNSLGSDLEEIEVYQKDLALTTLGREFSNIWVPVQNARPVDQILYYSRAKARLSMLFYAKQNSGKIILLIMLIILATVYLKGLKKIHEQKKLLRNDLKGQLILRYPLLSSITIVLNIFQFIFTSPPYIFSEMLWIISALCLTIIFQGFISRYWMELWVSMFILFLFACADNLILQASRPERYIMLVLALAGVITGLIALIRHHRKELRERWIIYFILFVVILETGSIIANLYGRYNLSKSLFTGGYFNVIIGILFLWTIRLVDEALSLASHVYTGLDKKLFYINFSKVGDSAPSLFYFFMIVGWFILFGRGFYSFRLISEPFKNFLFEERNLGEYTYTISNALIFFMIMGLSVIISKLVSYFAGDRSSTATGKNNKEKKTGLGSWILLVRIVIICGGLFIAFAAAGIPMDRITIIMGALGVGIGFGLQTLVNNLVSGLIIAFEKPVNVGDIIEVGTQAGTMKSIGFRSSIISTWAGADVVVPNGELLNTNLVNWTLSRQSRRMDIDVGVAYGTDLEKARKLILEYLAHDERILKYPLPLVIFQNFNNSSIDLQVFFWVRYFGDGLLVKSDAILAIDTIFRKNEITIPFPQQDLHIYSANNINKKGEEQQPLQ